ncbi:hypothetical protein, partial [Aeromonas sp. MrichA-1]|uniref:hypothetical protein n=1 Tax=Aeromonas sp. MrichA-1 TaxID=2823362 RepID=UPI001B33D5E7
TADFETIASRCESMGCRVFAGLLVDGWGLLGVTGERCRHFAAIFQLDSPPTKNPWLSCTKPILPRQWA